MTANLRNFFEVFNEPEAAAYLGVSRASLRRGRMEGKREKRLPPPPFIRLGRSIKYLKSDLDAYLQSHRVTDR
jgi:predicted DNA-binding transcriptional regulator AlpA